MAIIQIENPNAALRTVLDYRTGVSAEGEAIAYGGLFLPFRANAAVSRGALVAFVVPTQTVPLSVKERVVGDLTSMTVGVAVETATAAGQVILVCLLGGCLVNVGAAVVAAGEYGVHSGTAGLVASSAAAIDATIINGNILGVFLGTKDASNRASFFFQPR